MRTIRLLLWSLLVTAAFVAGAIVPSWLHAQTGGPVTVTGRDPKTGQPVVAVGSAADQSLRTHIVGTDPPLQPAATRIVGPLGNPLQTAVQNAGPVGVVVLANRTGDPCVGRKSNAAISQTANSKVLVGYPGHQLVICSLVVVGADAENLSFVEGTGATCGTSTLAVIGGTTAAAGPNLAANGGFSNGDGSATVAAQTIPGNDVCLFQSGSGRVAGNLTYAFTP